MNDMVAPQSKTHTLSACERREITVSGVADVVSFDESNVRLVTTCGILNLEGEELRIHVLNTKDGIVAVTGRLNGVLYENTDRESDSPSRPQGIRGRLFGR